MAGCPPKIRELVERFHQNIEQYKSGKYNEAQVRQEFIDPMFKELGWDMDNAEGNAEAYKDVIHEDAIKIGDATKAPDYAFRIGGQRKFFLEAKKPSVLIKEEIDPAYQIRRYAWSAKLPLSVLTDFEEFAVYDCRIKPDKNDKASTARVMYFRYTEYEEKWDEIAGIFSKEAILKGSFDRFAESTKKKKGTAEVDDAFLAEIENWRDVLAKNIALRNANISQRELNFAVQNSIDRIIFLRICEDRGIETYGRLMAAGNGDGIYNRLMHIFYEADDKYNSGLFHFKKEKGRESPDELSTALKIDDKVLRDILASLYYPASPYVFAVLPADILGQVYEQFLGKVIRLTAGHQAKVEDKPEVKKAGGVFYTPTFIVDYIVQNTVGKLLEASTPKKASAIKICDPACGSGSFLLGAYQYLLDWHRDFYVSGGPEKYKKELYKAASGEWRLAIQERKRILLNNIYGVDIDPQAVETTKLSLLLKVLEQETEESLRTNMKLFHERALPDLGNNIKCGNSLIGADYFEGKLALMAEDERYSINPFDWKAAFPSIFNGKAGGFSAIIGNPPYGASINSEVKTYVINKYAHQSYQLDSYLLFLERAIASLLSHDGSLGMIIPNTWATNLMLTEIRKFILSSVSIREIVHFKFKVFPKVTVDTEIILLEKPYVEQNRAEALVFHLREDLAGEAKKRPSRIIHDQRKWVALEGQPINIFLTKKEEALAKKCVSQAKPISNFFTINVGIKPYQAGKGTPPQSEKTVKERPFDSNKQLTLSYRPLLRGADINRYSIKPLEKRYLKFGKWLAEPRPAINFDAPYKIVIRQTGDSLVAALDDQKYLCLNNMHVLVPHSHSPESTLYYLGTINSKLLNWYYQSLNPEAGEALAEVKKTNVAKLPILEFGNNKLLQGKIASSAKLFITLLTKSHLTKTPHERDVLGRQIDAADRQIDKLVYDLYGLTEEEIAIVEKSTGEP
ncbi:MAG: N-6 DNA methylase [Nitrospinae bacterium]|nr:N-6 DNA methylase [Nitrospinota bacterium]